MCTLSLGRQRAPRGAPGLVPTSARAGQGTVSSYGHLPAQIDSQTEQQALSRASASHEVTWHGPGKQCLFHPHEDISVSHSAQHKGGESRTMVFLWSWGKARASSLQSPSGLSSTAKEPTSSGPTLQRMGQQQFCTGTGGGALRPHLASNACERQAL